MMVPKKIYFKATELLVILALFFWAIVIPSHVYIHTTRDMLRGCNFARENLSDSSQSEVKVNHNGIEDHPSPCLLCILGSVLNAGVAIDQYVVENVTFSYKSIFPCFISNSIDAIFQIYARAPPIAKSI